MTTRLGATGMAAIAAAAVALGGCRQSTICTTELVRALTPASSPSIQVGDAFTAHAWEMSCGGRERDEARVTWLSTDPTIVRVDAATGRATGVRPGQAALRAADADGEWPVQIVVTVRS